MSRSFMSERMNIFFGDLRFACIYKHDDFM